MELKEYILQNIIECLPFGIALLSEDLQFEYTNDMFLKRLGYFEKRGLIDQALDVICYNKESKECIYEKMDDSAQRNAAFEVTLKLKSGHPLQSVLFVSRILTNQTKGYLISSIDPRDFNPDSKDLNERIQALVQANTAKTNFLINSNHNIRLPLNNIAEYCRLLKLKQSNLQADSETADLVTGIQHNSSFLLNLTSSILDLTQIEKGKFDILEKEASNVEEILESVMQLFKQKAANKSLWFTYEIDQTVPQQIQTDKRLLLQILTRLVDNGIKYCERGKAVTLLVEKRDHNVVFKVRDEGKGIEKELQESIFKIYDEIDIKSQTEFDHTGLSLSLVNEWSKLLGGSMHLESSNADGSVFSLSIPLANVGRSPESEEKSSKSIELEFNNTTILIIEDNSQINELYNAWLDIEGVNVHIATNGEQGLALAKEIGPDIIVTDIHMPGMDGIETIKQIRRSSGLETIPIIVATADSFSDKEEQAVEAGCNEYLIKPLKYKKFLTVLQKHLPTKDSKVENQDENRLTLSIDLKMQLTDILETLSKISVIKLEQLDSKIDEMKKLFLNEIKMIPKEVHKLEIGAFSGKEKMIAGAIEAIKERFKLS